MGVSKSFLSSSKISGFPSMRWALRGMEGTWGAVLTHTAANARLGVKEIHQGQCRKDDRRPRNNNRQ